VVDHPVLEFLLGQLDFTMSGWTPDHIKKALSLCITDTIRLKYRKKGIKIDFETKDFTASGVFDRTNLNFVRQYIGGTCHAYLPAFSHLPHHSVSPLIATGDDGLRSVSADHAEAFLDWMDYLYYPK